MMHSLENEKSDVIGSFFMQCDQEENKDSVRDKWFDIFLCLVTSLTALFICSRSSWFYAFNNWDDANSYFSMGKAMMNGLVPYRDLFDQKGIMLYFMYGLGYLISGRTFHGVFIIEVMLSTWGMFAFLKLCRLYLSRSVSRILLPVMAAAVFTSRSFYWGGSAEEAMLPFLMWGLYLSVSYFKDTYPRPMPYKTVLKGGVLAGCILNIKFNSLGFFFGWIVMVLAAGFIGNRKTPESAASKVMGEHGRLKRSRIACFFVTGLTFLLGMFIATLPWLIYFAANNAVYDWLHVYIYLNVFVYSEKLAIAERIAGLCRTVYYHVISNASFSVWVIIGMIYWIICACVHKKNTKHSLMIDVGMIDVVNIVVMLGFLVLSIFGGGVDLPYYPLPVCVFAVTGMICAGRIAVYIKDEIAQRPFGKFIEKRVVHYIIYCVIIVSCVSYVLRCSVSLPFHSVDKDQLAVYQFSDIIEEAEIKEPKLLNMNCLDAGLYTVTGAVPCFYFYQTQTIHLDSVAKQQRNNIKEGRPDFIIARDGKPECIDEHYTCVSECHESFGAEWNHDFYLYQKTK